MTYKGKDRTCRLSAAGVNFNGQSKIDQFN